MSSCPVTTVRNNVIGEDKGRDKIGNSHELETENKREHKEKEVKKEETPKLKQFTFLVELLGANELSIKF